MQTLDEVIEAPKKPQLEFMDKKVFADVRERMKEGGLHLFSEVTMNSNQSDYYLPSSQAQSTRQFYYCEQKQIIIVLTHTESDFSLGENPTHLEGNWEIDAHIGFLRDMDELLALTPSDKVAEIPYFHGENGGRFAPEKFEYRGGHYSGMEKLVEGGFRSHEDFDCTDALKVASAAILIKNQVERYVRPLPFAELWISTFPFTHTFEGTDEIFWSRFDKRNLRALVTRPFGASGFKR